MTAKKILLVEDNTAVSLVLTHALSTLDDEIIVKSVTTGEEAQDQITVGEWDVVIADYSLPGINGLELVRQVSAVNKKSVSWVMITAFGDSEIMQEAFSLGVSDYLAKPFSLAKFRRAVASHLDFSLSKAEV